MPGRLYNSRGEDIGEDPDTQQSYGMDAPMPPTVMDGQLAAAANAPFVSAAVKPDPPPDMGMEGSDLEGQDSGEADAQDASVKNTMFSSGLGGMAPMAPVLDEGYKFLGWPGGEAGWKETMVDKPKQIEDAINAGAQAETDLGQARSDFFGRQQQSQQEEMAIIKARQMERQEEMAQRQAQLDDATKRYSNDLSDRGQFWRRPESILAAVGATLMAMAGSRNGDPGIGIRMMNQAVQADFMQRKEQADMHLGELRSNVSAYRQLAGDRELGDRMAYAESQRIAAMELERIAGQFQGPLAKAKAAAVSKELLRSYQLQMGQVYAAVIHQRAQRIDPGIKASLEKTARGNSDGYHAFGSDSGTNTPHGPPSTGTGGHVGIGGQATGQAGVAKAVRSNQLSKGQIEKLEERSPGSGKAMDLISQAVWRHAAQKAGTSNQNDPRFGKAMAEAEDKLEAGRQKIAEAMQKADIPARRASFMQLKKEISNISNLASRMKTTPDILLGSDADTVLGSDFTAKMSDKWKALAESDKGTDWQTTRRETEAAVKKFKQLYADTKSGVIHQRHGSAFTATEKELFAESARSGFDGIRNFVENGSVGINAEYKTALGAGGNNMYAIYWKASQGLETPVLDSKKRAPADPKANYDRDNKELSPNQKAAIRALSQKQVPPAKR